MQSADDRRCKGGGKHGGGGGNGSGRARAQEADRNKQLELGNGIHATILLRQQ